MNTSKATRALKDIGRTFFGRNYIAPLAAAMRTDAYILKRWGRGKGPANLSARLAKLADALLARHLSLAISAAEWRIRLRAQTDIVDVTLTSRLKDIQRDLEAKPPVPVEHPVHIYEEQYHNDPNRSIDDLVAGEIPMLAQNFREAMAEAEGYSK